MHAQDFQEPKEIQFGQKHQEDQEVTQRCEELKVIQIISKKSTQHKIDSKVHQVNKANANEHKGSLKHICPMTYLILRI
jgi:hypothetical protein